MAHFCACERLVQLTPVSGSRRELQGTRRPSWPADRPKLKKSRREALLAAFDAASPDAIVIEAFPFGRVPSAFELEALLEALETPPRPRILCSLRDIVVVPDE